MVVHLHLVTSYVTVIDIQSIQSIDVHSISISTSSCIIIVIVIVIVVDRINLVGLT